MRAAASRTFCTAGNNRPMRMAMMAITTSSSISVNARRRRDLNSLDIPASSETERCDDEQPGVTHNPINPDYTWHTQGSARVGLENSSHFFLPLPRLAREGRPLVK